MSRTLRTSSSFVRRGAREAGDTFRCGRGRSRCGYCSGSRLHQRTAAAARARLAIEEYWTD